MSDFKLLSLAVNARLEILTKHAKAASRDVYVSNIHGDALYAAYLAAFPEGTNPIFRVRTEHDCGCCKNFIRNLGRLLFIEDVDGKPVLKSVWGELKNLPAPYDIVAAALDKAVIEAGVETIFRTKESKFGQEYTFEDMATENGGVSKRWNHFHGTTPASCVTRTPGTNIGAYNGDLQVYGRGLRELSVAIVQSVIDLIEADNLYRGAEHLPKLKQFLVLKKGYDAAADKSLYILSTLGKPGYRIRNEVIGTMLDDLASGIPMEDAVRRFETKVAPTNYKRPKAIVTQKMIDEAVEKIRELGLEDSLQRRHATIQDISINNVLWADPTKRTSMKKGLLDSMAPTKAVKSKKAADGAIMDAAEFLSTIVPKADKLEIKFTGDIASNLMTLTAPVYPDAPGMFKWKNGFAWSYNGNITDSIKERVKKAGGNITGQMRVSLSWDNPDDLDLHIDMFSSNSHLYYGNRQLFGAFLDVDANGMNGPRPDPVENVAWTKAPAPGRYRIWVNQFAQRSKDNVGFTVEIEVQGKVYQISHPTELRSQSQIQVAVIEVLKDGTIAVLIENNSSLTSSGISRDVWGLATEQYVPVTAVMNSPNFWDDQQVGNLHTFFTVEGCKNPEPVRCMFNEFMRSDLEPHRRFLELLGNKSCVEPADDQLSGFGFSSTRGDTVNLRVTRGGRVDEIQVRF